jgi:hypothetical protein
MKRVQLEVNHFNFFCPMTGKQISGEEHPFSPSKATVFAWVDEGDGFEYARDEFKQVSDDNGQISGHYPA